MLCGSTMNTRDLKLRFVIKLLTKEGKKQKEIHERINAVYGDVSLKNRTGSYARSIYTVLFCVTS